MIITIKNTTFPSNTYITVEGSDCIVIDPGLDKNLIFDVLNEYQLTPLAVISTHGHFDHIASASDIIRKYEVPYYLHEKDLKLSMSANFFLKLAKIDFKIDIPTPDYLFRGFYESIKIGIFDIKVFNFPGHSNGSCIFQFGNNLFSGDIIYKNRVGFNNYPGEDKAKLKNSILEIFKIFSEHSLILPGHGESDSLSSIKTNNTELLNFLHK